MTRILFERNGIVSLGAVSKEEDLTPPGRISINAPPGDGRCDVCGRHMSELKPFSGPGDPLEGDFKGELLVKRWRDLGVYNDEAMEAIDEALASGNPLQWFINKYGAEKGEGLYWAAQAYGCISASWECRDCIVLDLDEREDLVIYFEKLRQRCVPTP